MTDKITTPIDAHRAGRFVLAVADADDTAWQTVLTETSDDRRVPQFAIELAAIIIGLAEQQAGPAWRNVLGAGLLDIELEHDTDGGGSRS